MWVSRPSIWRSLSIVLLLLGSFNPTVAAAGGCFGKRPTVAGTNDDEVLRGSPGRDVIAARAGDDIVNGRGGRDLICGGQGADLLRGEGGDDRLDGGLGLDDLVGSSGSDRLQDPDGGTTAFGGPGEDRFATGGGTDTLLGGPGRDHLDGQEGGPDEVWYVFAGGPLDVSLAAGTALGEGLDTLAGIEAVRGSDGTDSLAGDAGPNHLFGGAGDDGLAGSDGDDVVLGGPGSDRLDGGSGRDSLSFSSSPGPILLDLAAGAASGEGNDAVAGFELVFGSPYNDTMAGDDGPNVLHGSADFFFRAEDTDDLSGRGGDDVLAAVGGRNHGGPGIDTCWAGDENIECERGFTATPAPLPAAITEPLDEEFIDNAAFTGLTGEVTGKPFVSIRRLTPSGCRWWDGKDRRLVAGHCAVPLWNQAQAASGGVRRPWTYNVRGTLPAGWYQASVALSSGRKNDPGKEPSTGPAFVIDFRLI